MSNVIAQMTERLVARVKDGESLQDAALGLLYQEMVGTVQPEAKLEEYRDRLSAEHFSPESMGALRLKCSSLIELLEPFIHPPERELLEAGCTCFISAPCAYCTENVDAWEAASRLMEELR